MITGAHSIIYSKNPEADRDFFRDVLQLTKVDVGQGWLIFGLPPAEVALHPGAENDQHELYLMCDDVNAFVAEMKTKNISCGDVQDMGWGVLTQLSLPGGGKLGVYQPRHARPEPMSGKYIMRVIPRLAQRAEGPRKRSIAFAIFRANTSDNA
jgi:hypothetical protein